MLTKKKKPDITLITYGGMASLAIEASFNVFMQEEINVDIIIPSLIKPFPIADIQKSCNLTGKVIIVEEGVYTSGWGAELGSQIYETAFYNLTKPIKRIGAKNFPIPNSKPLEEKMLPQVSDIEEAIYKHFGD